MEEQTFLGKFGHALDAQNRVAIPSEWRGSGADPPVFVLFHGRHDRLMLFPESVFNHFVERVRGGSFASDELQELLAWVGEKTRRCPCDKQGRVKLDRDLLTRCGIADQLELVGAVTHILLRAPRPDGSGDASRDEKFFDKMRAFADDNGVDFIRALGLLGRK